MGLFLVSAACRSKAGGWHPGPRGGTGWRGCVGSGSNEKSWGKGSGKYLVIVTDHDAGRVAWIGEGRCQATVEAFFDDPGPERAGLLTHVSADGAQWIHPVVREKAPQAQPCLDAFHVVKEAAGMTR